MPYMTHLEVSSNPILGINMCVGVVEKRSVAFSCWMGRVTQLYKPQPLANLVFEINIIVM
jgi:hypothetical protein